MIKNALFYLKKRLGVILLFLLFTAVFSIVFYLYNSPVDAVSYAFLLNAAVGSLVLIADFIRYLVKCRRLEKISGALFSVSGEFPIPSDRTEFLYQEIAEKLYHENTVLESNAVITRREMLDYYTLWAHQIKTPIAAMRLLLQSENAEERSFHKAMKMELFRTEQYVEMVLSYLRMENMSSDLVLQSYSLDNIIKQAVRKYSQMFITQKISLQYDSVNIEVLTDGKWLGLVLEQILSNALKYSKEGKEIRIYMHPGKEAVLVIEDQGIGIQEEDLPRVFEKGFTGYNGREHRKSTGIGLYLCRQIIEKLNHNIWIESVPDAGTKVFLDLYREDRRLE